MKKIIGTGVSTGIAFGPVVFLKSTAEKAVRKDIEDAQAEVERFERAREIAHKDLQELYKKALLEVGEAHSLIFEIHQMMLSDEDFLDSIKNIIRNEMINAEYAVEVTAGQFSEMFASMDDDYMKERAADVKDIATRLLNILAGKSRSAETFDSPVILAADDLAPSETITLDKSKILAFVTRKGAANSHTAILARMMGIPAVVALHDQLSEDFAEKFAAVDGTTGELIVEPDQKTEAMMRERAEEEKQRRLRLSKLKGAENKTIDGVSIDIFANIGAADDVKYVLENDAGGIGLFRSEFLYLDSSDYPSEDEQLEAYKRVLSEMNGKKVVIRTLDIGADKKIGYFDLAEEENPALGYRALRICLDRKELFKTQIRALLRASVFGKLAIMMPMVASAWEVLEAKQVIDEVKTELSGENIDFDENVEIGIMIETPAAAVIADTLAPLVDFFSVGTNDLTQYTLAVDRQNQAIERHYDPHHLAVLRLIKMAADAAHKNGIWIGICGELACDTSLTATFLAMGIDELSVSPPMVLAVREAVRSTDVSSVSLLASL